MTNNTMVNVLYIGIILTLLCCSVAQQIPTIKIPKAATSGNEVENIPNGPGYNSAAGKYIFVRSPHPGPVGAATGRIIVFIRDDDGRYPVAYQVGWPRVPYSVSTNGNYFGTLGQGWVDLVQLNATGNFVNLTKFASTAKIIHILKDDSIVLLDDTSIDTYEYIASNWTLTHHQTVNFVVNSFFVFDDPNDSAPHVTDTTLAGYNPSNHAVELYTRNADKSWTLVDYFVIDEYRANRILWNGGDTVLLSDTTYLDDYRSDPSIGRVLIFVKTDGQWQLVKSLYNGDYSLELPGYFGYSMVLFNSELIAISAPNNGTGGEVFLLQRINGDWIVTVRFVGDKYWSYFGYNLFRNDYDIVIQTNTPLPNITYQATVPQCYMPMKYECHDITVDMCQSDILSDQLYTVGDSCTAVTMDSFRIEDDVTTFSFRFSREWSDTFYCNSTVTCLKSPTATPPTSVTPVSAPIDAPASSPLSNRVPVAAPVEAGKTSESYSLHTGFMATLSGVVGLVLW